MTQDLSHPHYALRDGIYRLLIDVQQQPEYPVLIGTIPCGECSIVATGLTKQDIRVAKYVFDLPFKAKFWPVEYPSLEMIYKVRLALFNNPLP
jgi:hypothetical protein